MSSADMLKANSVPPPRKSVVRAKVTSIESFVVPVEWMNGWISVHNDGASDMGIKFGASKAETDAMTTLTAVSTRDGATFTVDQPVGTPGEMIDGGRVAYYNLAEFGFTPENFNATESRVWIGHLALAADGYIRINKSSGPTNA